MITEDYVSFETSKLLKKRGFEGDINAYYHIWDNGNRVCSVQEFSHSEAPHLYIPAPTLQMAMKWLREEEQLYIMLDFERQSCIEYKIYKYEPEIGRKDLLHYDYGDSYEQACEVAIKYCLEKLI